MRAERKSFSAVQSHGCVIQMVLRKLNLSDDVYVNFIVKHGTSQSPGVEKRGRSPEGNLPAEEKGTEGRVKNKKYKG